MYRLENGDIISQLHDFSPVSPTQKLVGKHVVAAIFVISKLLSQFNVHPLQEDVGNEHISILLMQAQEVRWASDCLTFMWLNVNLQEDCDLLPFL